jgi:hypothetical protein
VTTRFPRGLQSTLDYVLLPSLLGTLQCFHMVFKCVRNEACFIAEGPLRYTGAEDTSGVFELHKGWIGRSLTEIRSGSELMTIIFRRPDLPQNDLVIQTVSDRTSRER